MRRARRWRLSLSEEMSGFGWSAALSAGNPEDLQELFSSLEPCAHNPRAGFDIKKISSPATMLCPSVSLSGL
jgi:hypothetical protein